MDDELNEKADERVTLPPNMVEKVRCAIVYLSGSAHVLRALSRRSYISIEQAAQIRAEAAELEKEDIEPLRAALRDGALSTTQRARIERLGRANL